LEEEERCLKKELLEKDPYKQYTEAAAAAEAKGVVSNRVQNIVITLDKVRMFLGQAGQPQDPCLRLLEEKEVIDFLWTGSKSIVSRLLRGAIKIIAPNEALRIPASFALKDVLLDRHAKIRDKLPQNFLGLAAIANKTVDSAEHVRENLIEFESALRTIDYEVGGGLSAACDLCLLYAHTQKWFTYAKGYKTITSPKVPINLEDLFLNRDADDESTSEDKLKSSAQNMAKQHASTLLLSGQMHRMGIKLVKIFAYRSSSNEKNL